MEFELAPMEGITTYIYRNAFNTYFGGIDTYYTPFLSNYKLNYKEIRDILPENNEGLRLVPQILTNKADEFLSLAKELSKYGYDEVNLNLGCPSGTVTSKKRGAGFLSVPNELDIFLAEIFEKCPVNISIKTRIGVSDESEWDGILDIYSKYPIKKLIIHTRLLKDMYKHPTRPESFENAVKKLDIPLGYNGDIVSSEAYNEIKNIYGDKLNCVMLGRGLIANPNLVLKLKGVEPKEKEVYHEFTNTLLDKYTEQLSGGNKVILFKMKEIWVYLHKSFANPDKYFKKIKKSKNIEEYKIAVNLLFNEQEII